MQTTVFYIIISLMFLICAFLFTRQVINALRFQKNIADGKGFTHGIMTGAAFPILITFLAALTLQFTSFIFLIPKTEFEYCIRTLIYIITFIGFHITQRKTPPLLAYWFGRTAFWDIPGEKGRIEFSDIYCSTLAKCNDPLPVNDQRLCKFSFYVKTRAHHGIPKKFTCKVTALELTRISEQVDIYHYSDAKALKKEQLEKHKLLSALYCLKCVFAFSLAMLIFSSGMFFTPRYDPENYDRSKEINTVTEITSVQTQNGITAVYYGKIFSVSVYSSGGAHTYSLVLSHSDFENTDIRINNNLLYCKHANTVDVYNLTNGTLIESAGLQKYSEIFSSPAESEYTTDGVNVYKLGPSGEREYLVKREPYVYAFISAYSWIVFIVTLAAIFTIKYYLSDRTPPEAREPKPKKERPMKTKKLPHPKKDSTDISKKDIPSEQQEAHADIM